MKLTPAIAAVTGDDAGELTNSPPPPPRSAAPTSTSLLNAKYGVPSVTLGDDADGGIQYTAPPLPVSATADDTVLPLSVTAPSTCSTYTAPPWTPAPHRVKVQPDRDRDVDTNACTPPPTPSAAHSVNVQPDSASAEKVVDDTPPPDTVTDGGVDGATLALPLASAVRTDDVSPTVQRVNDDDVMVAAAVLVTSTQPPVYCARQSANDDAATVSVAPETYTAPPPPTALQFAKAHPLIVAVDDATAKATDAATDTAPPRPPLLAAAVLQYWKPVDCTLRLASNDRMPLPRCSALEDDDVVPFDDDDAFVDVRAQLASDTFQKYERYTLATAALTFNPPQLLFTTAELYMASVADAFTSTAAPLDVTVTPTTDTLPTPHTDTHATPAGA